MPESYDIEEYGFVEGLLTDMVLGQLDEWLDGFLDDFLTEDNDIIVPEDNIVELYQYIPYVREEGEFVYLFENLLGKYQQKTQLIGYVEDGEVIAYGEKALEGFAAIDVPWICSYLYLGLFTSCTFKFIAKMMGKG